MNSLAWKGRWNIARGKLKQKLAQLARNEHGYAEGKENELLGRIQKRSAQAEKQQQQDQQKAARQAAKTDRRNNHRDGKDFRGSSNWSPT